MEASTPNALIPQVLHLYWGEPEVPEPFATWEARWRALHPAWRVECWHPGRMPALRYPHLLALCDHFAEVSDVLRILLLADHGGVWADRDTWAVRPIDVLTRASGAFLGYLQRSWGENCLMGGAPGHPFWEFAAERLRENMEDERAVWRGYGPFSRTLHKTGPRFLGRCLREWAKTHGPPELAPAPRRWRAPPDAPETPDVILPQVDALRLYGPPVISWRPRGAWLAGETSVADGALVMHLFGAGWCAEADRWNFEAPDDPFRRR